MKDLISLTWLLSLFFTLNVKTFAKVEAQNYNFSLDELALFAPGQPLEKIKEKYKDIDVIKESGEEQIIKIYVAQTRYKYPVYIQLKNNTSIGYYAKLPTYFLHDIFHQSLINRYGKQDSYKKQESEAIYIWKNANGNMIVYNGACTITCFPVYLSVMKKPKKEEATKPLLQQFMNIDLFKKI